MLLMKRRFIELIKAGKKRQTIRLWAYPRVRRGQNAYVPGLGYVRIVSIEEISSLRALTRADAIADGFASRAALLREIAAIYGQSKGRCIFRVRFSREVTRRVTRKRSAVPQVTVQARARRALREYVLARMPA